jgi:hypothetical protein
MSNYITIRTKTKINENGRIFKQWEDYEIKCGRVPHMFMVLDIIKKYDFDFFPKVLAWDEKGYSYEFVEGETLAENINFTSNLLDKVDTKFIYEVKIALDNIWEELYNASMELWNGKQFLFHNDLNNANMIYNQDSRKLILLDLNSVAITNYIPFSHSFHKTFGALETSEILNHRKII